VGQRFANHNFGKLREYLFALKNLDKDEQTWGALLEVDLDYRRHLHDMHDDYPLAPEKKTIRSTEISDYSFQQLGDRIH